MNVPVRFRYRIERRSRLWNVVFPELPEANFSAPSAAAAQAGAPDRMLAALAARLQKGDVPAAHRAHAGEAEAELPVYAQAKALFVGRALELGVQAADVARALEISRQEAARLFDLAHPTKIDASRRALRALGCDLALGLDELPEGPAPALLERPRRGRTRAG